MNKPLSRPRPHALLDSCLGVAPVFAMANSFVRAVIIALGMLSVGLFVALGSLASLRLFGERRGKAFLFSVAVFGATVYALLVRLAAPADFDFMGPYLALLAFNGMTIVLVERCDEGPGARPGGLAELALGTLSWSFAVIVFGFLRELLGSGKVVLYASKAGSIGFSVPGMRDAALRFVLHPGGGLLLFGLLAGLLDSFRRAASSRAAARRSL